MIPVTIPLLVSIAGFAKRHWKWLLPLVSAVGLFFVGRCTTPPCPQPEVKYEKVIDEKRLEEERKKIVDEYEAKLKQRIERNFRPDGSLEKEVIDTDSTTKGKTTTDSVKFVEVEKKVVERIEVKPLPKDWLIVAMASVAPAQIGIRDGKLDVPLLLGAQIQRRFEVPVIGEVYAGGGVMVPPADLKLKNVSLTLSLSKAF